MGAEGDYITRHAMLAPDRVRGFGTASFAALLAKVCNAISSCGEMFLQYTKCRNEPK